MVACERVKTGATCLVSAGYGKVVCENGGRLFIYAWWLSGYIMARANRSTIVTERNACDANGAWELGSLAAASDALDALIQSRRAPRCASHAQPAHPNVPPARPSSPPLESQSCRAPIFTIQMLRPWRSGQSDCAAP